MNVGASDVPIASPSLSSSLSLTTASAGTIIIGVSKHEDQNTLGTYRLRPRPAQFAYPDTPFGIGSDKRDTTISSSAILALSYVQLADQLRFLH